MLQLPSFDEMQQGHSQMGSQSDSPGRNYAGRKGARCRFAKQPNRTESHSKVSQIEFRNDFSSVLHRQAAGRRSLSTAKEIALWNLDCRLFPSQNDVLRAAGTQLEEYFRGDRREFTIPLLTPGSDFQEAVWKQLLAIPYGETRSYQPMAKSLGVPDGSRAEGKANGDNRIAIIFPCHRVIRGDGNLCGYAGGLWRKQRLLELETGQGGLSGLAF